MSKQSPLPHDDASIQWTDAVSEKGVPFQVGFSNASASGADDTAVQGKRDFGIDVNWPLTDNAWTDTNQDVKSTAAISRYALGPNGGGTWAYILHFSNTEHYNYYFSDKTGDGYQVNTFRNGDHYVRYNSSDPAITFIKGS